MLASTRFPPAVNELHRGAHLQAQHLAGVPGLLGTQRDLIGFKVLGADQKPP